MRGTAALAARSLPEVRPARAADLDELVRFIAGYAADGTLLPVQRADLLRRLDGTLVAALEGKLIGCGALHRVEPALGEIRTLAVDPAHRGRGVGGRILEGLLEEARRRGMTRVFCLTRRTAFFGAHGFAIVEKERFPTKVWNDCRSCPRLAGCDEVAMERSVIEPGGWTPRPRPR